MKIKIIFLFATFLISTNSYAQDWLWASPGVINDQSKLTHGTFITKDSSMNFYITGHFDGRTIILGNIELFNSDTSGNSTDMFLAKYSSNGNIIWANCAGGSSWDYGNGITVNNIGDVYVCGDFRSPEMIIGKTKLKNTTQDAMDADIFIAKYDSNCKLLWAKSAGGKKNDRGVTVYTDSLDNVYLSGTCLSEDMTFSSITISNPEKESYMAYEYLAKYDGSGNISWVKENDKELKELKKQFQQQLEKCIIQSNIKISCAGCTGVLLNINIKIDAVGKMTSYQVIRESLCGDMMTVKFKTCMIDWLKSLDFSENLRNKCIELHASRMLKC